MTSPRDPVAAAIDDARALLATMREGEWGELQLSYGDLEISISRQPRPGIAAVADAPEAEVAAAATTGVRHEVTAPHVATLVHVAAQGTPVTAGDVIASVSVLDEPQDIVAPASGHVAEVALKAGDLVEFGQVIAVLEEAS